MTDTLAVGKLDMEFLAALLEQYAHTDDERVVIGPRVGEDALVIDFGDRFLVAKTDPITFATDEIGWYAVNVNANDIATTGATCRWFLATLLLPEGTDHEATGGDHLCSNVPGLPFPGHCPVWGTHRDHLRPGSAHRRRPDAG